MSRKTVDPRLNASLIREGRLIFQQLSQIFGSHSRPTTFNDVMIAEAETKAKKAPKLKCGRCMKLQNTPVHEAVTIYNGDALCDSHAMIAFSIVTN